MRLTDAKQGRVARLRQAARTLESLPTGHWSGDDWTEAAVTLADALDACAPVLPATEQTWARATLARFRARLARQERE